MSSDASTTPARAPKATTGKTRIEGRMGVPGVVFAVLAYTAPIAGTASFVAVIIAYGNGVGAPSAFLVVGALLFVFSVGFLALAKAIPRPGGYYSLITAALGKRVGLGAGFVSLLGYVAGGVSLTAFGALSISEYIVARGGPEIPWYVCLIPLLLGVGILAYRRVELSAKVLGVILTLEVGIVLVFNFVVLFNGGPEGRQLDSFTWGGFTQGSVPIALLFCLVLFAGFEGTLIYREEVRNANRTIPRATYIVVGFITVFYTFTSWMLITAFGSSQVLDATAADPAIAFASAVNQHLGNVGVDVVAALIVTSTFASSLSITNVATRYVYSLSVDQVLPPALGVPHPRLKSPARASLAIIALFVVVFAALAIAGVSPWNIYLWLAGTFVYGMILLMAIVSLAVIVYFRKHPEGASLWKTVLAPAIALAALIAVILFSTMNFELLVPESVWVQAALIVPVYLIFIVGIVWAAVLARRRPESFARIGRE